MGAYATDVIKRVKHKLENGDCGAALEPEAVEALAVIKQNKPADFQRIRSELKQVNPKVSLGAIDATIKARAVETDTDIAERTAGARPGHAKR